MAWFFEILLAAGKAMLSPSAELIHIVTLTLSVTFSALILSTLLAIPLAAYLAISSGRFAKLLILLINSLMAFPPILAGLLVYMLLSRQGPLGFLDMLFTPKAMILAQCLLIFPIVCGLSQQVLREKNTTLSTLFWSLRVSRFAKVKTLIYESRYQLTGALVTGLGRGLAEVGAVMIAGGNILHYTRTITTSIALQTSQGEIVNAVSLGLILLLLAIGINLLILWVQRRAEL